MKYVCTSIVNALTQLIAYLEKGTELATLKPKQARRQHQLLILKIWIPNIRINFETTTAHKYNTII
jgi:hypothetical protein